MNRVKYGEEKRFAGSPPAADERCSVCYAKPGEFHYQGCGEEEKDYTIIERTLAEDCDQGKVGDIHYWIVVESKEYGPFTTKPDETTIRLTLEFAH